MVTAGQVLEGLERQGPAQLFDCFRRSATFKLWDMAKKAKQKAKRRLTKKPVLSSGQKGQLRRIMKTVRDIKIWNQQHGR
jgi:hypothetical protein